ncbi:MAG: ImmA/IrrE family metallo-endopeptidase [Pseudomonadota bacterium]
MAQGKEPRMNVESYPEKKLAARLVSKKKLAPPIDIFSLAKQYANVDSMLIPFDVDGICLHLKVPKMTPHIIVNNCYPSQRMRFTLAHELGHVIIPWHIGSIIDITTIPEENKFDEYWYLEAEANRFASELLMPSAWVKAIIESHSDDMGKITKQIVREAEVSPIAATIKIKDTLDCGYIFAALRNNEVLFSGRSEETLANPPKWGEKILPEEVFPFCKNRHQFMINGVNYYWWVLDKSVSIPKSAELADWRELLKEIISEIGIPTSGQKKFIQSLNGVIANANGSVRDGNRTQESLYSAILQRIHGKTELKKFANHHKFDSFIYSKIKSFLNC